MSTQWEKRLGQWIKSSLCAGAMLSLASCVSVDFGEAEMFRPRPGPGLTAEAAIAAGYQFEPLDIVAQDGVHLRGGLLKKQDASFTIIFFGGNIATAARTGLRRARELAPLNVNVVLVDYRSYGGSDVGPMSSEIFLQDGLSVFDHVVARSDINAERLVVHGHSMGSLIAGYVAANRQTAGVVLESSATTTQAYADNQVPWYGRPFVRVDVAESLRQQGNLNVIGRIDEALMVIVGECDRDTPVSFSRQLYEASPLPSYRRRLVIVSNAGHSDVFGQPSALDEYGQFLGSMTQAASDQ
ncbi:MAG: alpha/beta hydrolase [Hyphomonadaceae bacterium]